MTQKPTADAAGGSQACALTLREMMASTGQGNCGPGRAFKQHMRGRAAWCGCFVDAAAAAAVDGRSSSSMSSLTVPYAIQRGVGRSSRMPPRKRTRASAAADVPEDAPTTSMPAAAQAAEGDPDLVVINELAVDLAVDEDDIPMPKDGYPSEGEDDGPPLLNPFDSGVVAARGDIEAAFEDAEADPTLEEAEAVLGAAAVVAAPGTAAREARRRGQRSPLGPSLGRPDVGKTAIGRLHSPSEAPRRAYASASARATSRKVKRQNAKKVGGGGGGNPVGVRCCESSNIQCLLIITREANNPNAGHRHIWRHPGFAFHGLSVPRRE
jgi:hypothetical protein